MQQRYYLISGGVVSLFDRDNSAINSNRDTGSNSDTGNVISLSNKESSSIFSKVKNFFGGLFR